MGRRGRPPKVKELPQRALVSDLDKESSSSPDRFLFQSSRAREDVPTHSSNPTLSPAPGSVGLSWVSVLKGSSSKPGNPPISNDTSPSVVPVIYNRTVPLPQPACSPTVRQIAKISKVDIEPEIKFWELIVVCYVSSANPPLHVIDGFGRRIWRDLNIDKVGMVNRGVLLVRFASKEHQDEACNINGILFDKKPFIVKLWYPNILYEKASQTSIPVWVKLHNLDICIGMKVC